MNKVRAYSAFHHRCSLRRFLAADESMPYAVTIGIFLLIERERAVRFPVESFTGFTFIT